jgi:hypothetical protein
VQQAYYLTIQQIAAIPRVGLERWNGVSPHWVGFVAHVSPHEKHLLVGCYLSGSISYPKTVNSWFNPAAFSVPTGTGTDIYDNLGFNALRGPGRDDWNLSLFKSLLISESRGSRFELRADAFNTWNHTQFKEDVNNGGISLNAGAGNFGAVTGAFDPREFQLGAKLIF